MAFIPLDRRFLAWNEGNELAVDPLRTLWNGPGQPSLARPPQEPPGCDPGRSRERENRGAEGTGPSFKVSCSRSVAQDHFERSRDAPHSNDPAEVHMRRYEARLPSCPVHAPRR
jgi:hypothetical protein